MSKRWAKVTVRDKLLVLGCEAAKRILTFQSYEIVDKEWMGENKS